MSDHSPTNQKNTAVILHLDKIKEHTDKPQTWLLQINARVAGKNC